MTSEPNETQSTSATPSLDAIADDIFCQHCGYNLKMLTGDRCPECGESIASVRAINSQIPWVYRKELGWWRAYWKTVWLVMFRRRRLAEEMARPVNYRDSQLFRLTTIAIVCGAGLLTSISLISVHATCPMEEPIILFFWQNLYACAPLYILVLLFLLATTGIPSYFFHPRRLSIKLQNRAVALSFYSCAPLALAPFAALAVAGPLLFRDAKGDEGALMLFAGFVLFVLCANWWAILVFLARRIMPEQKRRAWYVAIFVPSLWLISGTVIFVLLPMLSIFVWTVFASLM